MRPDVEEFFCGISFDAYRLLGSHPAGPGRGWLFTLWAPHARRVQLLGDWNGWDLYSAAELTFCEDGLWRGRVPQAQLGQLYKYNIQGPDGSWQLRADPFAFAFEALPGTASRLAEPNYPFAAPLLRGARRDAPVLIYELHAAGIAVLMDFVPVHFAPDADRLACFDGAPLFESGPSDWGSLNFDLASPPVRSFLLSSAAFWLQVCRCDGLRVDAIGNALYHCPNGWQAAEFFKTLTAGLHARFPGCMLVAEDSAGSMNATFDTASGGLGFDYVWEIGWTQDTLAYFAAPFGGRSALFRQLCGSFGPFGAVQGINALSHDENHPASIFTRLYGNVEEKLAQMRLLLLLQAARPGKCLLFAGVEFGQPDAFTDGREPNWAMLADAEHRALADYSKALNAFCLAHPALYAPQSFAWTAQDASTGVLGFTLQAGCETLLCALNTGTQAVQGFGLKPGWGSCALPLFAAGWVDHAPRPIANGWLALDLAPLSGGIWQIE